MFEKFYFNVNNDNFEKQLRSFKNLKREHRDLKFTVMFDSSDVLSFEKQKRIASALLSCGVRPDDIILTVKEDSHKFKSEDWEKIQGIAGYFGKHNIKFGFEDMHKTWTPKEVERANSKITKTANNIKKAHLSPYESLLGVYLLITSRGYLVESEKEHYSQSRSVYGVLNSRNICCVGYSELFSAIMKEIDDKNIKIYNNSVATSSDNKTLGGGHRNLIVYVDDPKYKIKGYYYMDPTWDSVDEHENTTLSYFMIPLSDIDKIKHKYIRDKDCLEPAKEEGKKKLSKFVGAHEDLVYNSKQEKELCSFTADGKKITKQFVYDFFDHNNDSFEEADIKLRDEMLDDTIGLEESYFKEIEVLTLAKELVKDINFEVSYEDYISLKDVVISCAISDDNTPLYEFVDDIKDRYNKSRAYIDSIRKDEYPKSVYMCDMKELIDDKLKQTREGVSYIERQLETEPLNKKRIINYAIPGFTGKSNLMTKLLSDPKYSKPIELYKTQLALKRPLKAFDPTITDEDIIDITNRLVDETCKKSLDSFENAENAFYVEAKTRKLERQNSSYGVGL